MATWLLSSLAPMVAGDHDSAFQRPRRPRCSRRSMAGPGECTTGPRGCSRTRRTSAQHGRSRFSRSADRRRDRPPPPRVHPRVWGESSVRSSPWPPSPGPFPACAGNPSSYRGRRAATRVHPPRVRGIRSTGLNTSTGSIPACAGNPPRLPLLRAAVTGSIPACAGESPRVRGIRSVMLRRRALTGSIPACAGNPTCARRWTASCRVHPRVCGESTSHRRAPSGPSPRVRGIPARPGPEAPGAPGPSPRVRGIPDRPSGRPGRAGSIPACAGTLSETDSAGYTPGPSPRVRGIRGRRVPGDVPGGSIPACAGNPTSPPNRSVPGW